MKLLITSVGSLVGQNILDVLDSQIFPRRHLVTVIGTNCLADASNNFRCDKCYLVPVTSSKEFAPAMINLLREESPDLILVGRDEDTETVARLMDAHPELPGRLPYGKTDTLLYGLDKWQTWLFAQKHALRFAETFRMGQGGGLAELKSFADRCGYPLIAKPLLGYASKGVFFVQNWAEAESISARPGYIFQEYLGAPDTMREYFESMRGPVPLFAHAPNISHYTCHTIIGPTGTISPFFISHNRHDSGKTVGFQKLENADLERHATAYAEALVMAGGAGPLGIQFQRDRYGEWKAQEINMRTNGNTFPRFVMGQDDIGLIAREFLPELAFPVYLATDVDRPVLISKYLASFSIASKDLTALTEKGVWASS